MKSFAHFYTPQTGGFTVHFLKYFYTYFDKNSRVIVKGKLDEMSGLGWFKFKYSDRDCISGFSVSGNISIVAAFILIQTQ